MAILAMANSIITAKRASASVWPGLKTAALRMSNAPLLDQRAQAKGAPRQLTVRLQTHHEALQTARQRQETPEFKARYALRAGVESSLSQGTRRMVDLPNRVRTSFTSVGSLADSPEPPLRPSPATRHTAEILDV